MYKSPGLKIRNKFPGTVLLRTFRKIYNSLLCDNAGEITSDTHRYMEQEMQIKILGRNNVYRMI